MNGVSKKDAKSKATKIKKDEELEEEKEEELVTATVKEPYEISASGPVDINGKHMDDLFE